VREHRGREEPGALGAGHVGEVDGEAVRPLRDDAEEASVTWAGVPTSWMSSSERIQGAAFRRATSRSLSAIRMPTRTTCWMAS
jgi:hypothetical protein